MKPRVEIERDIALPLAESDPVRELGPRSQPSRGRGKGHTHRTRLHSEAQNVWRDLVAFLRSL
jgi:hypothetical protein